MRALTSAPRAAAPRLLLALAISVACIAAGPSRAAAAGPPLIESTSASGVTATAATLSLRISANGLATAYRFEYIREAEYEGNLTAVPPRNGFAGAAQAPFAGAAAIGSAAAFFTFTQRIIGLNPLTRYRFRAVATNSAGTATGPEGSLLTEPPAPIPCIADACQALPVPPEDPTPGTLVPNSGNPPLHFPKAKKKKRHQKKKRHHDRKHHGQRRHQHRGGGGR